MKVIDFLFRFLDRYLGIPLVYLVHFFRSKHPFPQQIRTIGVIQKTGLGELVIATGLLEDLKRHWRQARIVLFTGSVNYELGQLLSTVDKVVALPSKRPFQAIRLLREQSPDILIDLGQWSRYDALLAAASGARYTIGFKTPGQLRHYLYDAAALHSDKIHELENFRALFRLLGPGSVSLPNISLKSGLSITELPAGTPQSAPYVVFHLWVPQRQRQWSLERWKKLAAHFNSRGLSVILTGSKSEHSLIRDFLTECRGADAIILDGSTDNLLDTLRWLAHARLVISISNGIMHLAAALEVPVIGLHGPTSPRRWGPIGRRTTSVQSCYPGSGYLNLGIEQNRANLRLPCMEAITVEQVIEAAEPYMVDLPAPKGT